MRMPSLRVGKPTIMIIFKQLLPNLWLQTTAFSDFDFVCVYYKGIFSAGPRKSQLLSSILFAVSETEENKKHMFSFFPVWNQKYHQRNILIEPWIFDLRSFHIFISAAPWSRSLRLCFFFRHGLERILGSFREKSTQFSLGWSGRRKDKENVEAHS